MGALHAGHISLMDAARRECDFVVASIFVNPAQFGPHEDFNQYPRDLERDRRLCEQAGMDLIFHPATATIYPEQHATFIDVTGLSDRLEGQSRPGHFRGVATVVLKLFNIVLPDVAYFGQKDFQQQALIRRMCHDLNVPVEIRVCPTVREADGLALSSRNVYLSPEERQSALALSQSLKLARKLLDEGETDAAAIGRQMRALLESTPLVTLDYATLIDTKTLAEVAHAGPDLAAVVAARVGRTRLIDNQILRASDSPAVH